MSIKSFALYALGLVLGVFVLGGGIPTASAQLYVNSASQCPQGSYAVPAARFNNQVTLYFCSPDKPNPLIKGTTFIPYQGESEPFPWDAYWQLQWDTAAQRGADFLNPEAIESPLFRLGMWSTPSSATPSIEALGSGTGGVIHGSGFGSSDTAGLIKPGTPTPTFHDSYGGGGMSGIVDASALVGANQSLKFLGFFHYTREDVGYGPDAATLALGLAGGSGTVQNNTYTFGTGLRYEFGASYLNAGGDFKFGDGTEYHSADGSSGKFSSNGYAGGATLGHVFTLWKVGPAAATPAYTIGLDLSGHLGYFNDWDHGFTDSSGFTFGTERISYGDVGGRARLFAQVASYGLTWRPYIAATIDQRFGFSHTFNLPSQAALPTGDLVTFGQAQTFLGAQLGVDVLTARGWTVGVKGFFAASTDANIAGGSIYLKIPFGEPAPVTVAAR